MYNELSFKQVDEIQNMCYTYGITTKQLAKLYEVSERTIHKVLSGRYIVTVKSLEASEVEDTSTGGEVSSETKEASTLLTRPFTPTNSAYQEGFLINTNPYLKDPELRDRLIKRSVLTSSAVEDIYTGENEI